MKDQEGNRTLKKPLFTVGCSILSSLLPTTQVFAISSTSLSAPNPSRLTFPAISLISLGGFAIVFLLILFLRGLKGKRELREIQDWLSELLANTAKSLEPIRVLAELSQGKTAVAAKAHEATLTDLLFSIEAIFQKIKKEPFILNVKKISELQETCKEAATRYDTTVRKAREKAEPLLELDRTIAAFIEQQKTASVEASTLLAKLSETTGGAYNDFATRIAAINTDIRSADDIDEFDPLTAIEAANQAEYMLKRITSELTELRDYATKVAEIYPMKVKACRDVIAAIVLENGLHAVGSAAYVSIEKSREQIDQLSTALKTGNLDTIRIVWMEIEQLLANSTADVHRLIQLRLSNQERINRLELIIKKLNQDQLALKKAFESLRTKFTSPVWEGLDEQFVHVTTLLHAMPQRLLEAERLNSDEKQQFDQAHAQIEQISGDLNSVTRSFSSFLESIQNKNQALEQVFVHFQAATESYQQAKDYADSHKFDIDFGTELRQLVDSVEESQQMFNSLKEQKPCPLIELEQSGGAYYSAVKQYQDIVIDVMDTVEDATNNLGKIITSLNNLYNLIDDYRSKQSLKSTVNQTKALIESYMINGEYIKAGHSIDNLNQLTSTTYSQLKLKQRI